MITDFLSVARKDMVRPADDLFHAMIEFKDIDESPHGCEGQVSMRIRKHVFIGKNGIPRNHMEPFRGFDRNGLMSRTMSGGGEYGSGVIMGIGCFL